MSQNQIRGGIGIFTGPPPYILLGNAYANTGLGLVRLKCDNSSLTTQAPPLTVDVGALPTACAGQAAPGAGAAGTLGVNITDPNFKYPQYLGLSAGVGPQLPGGLLLTVGGMESKAVDGGVG